MESSDFKSQPKNRHTRHNRENPSFSSTLLDSIYRSIDEPAATGLDLRTEQYHYQQQHLKTMKKKQSASPTTTTSGRHGHGLFKEAPDHEITSLRRACLIEKWMEKKVTEKTSPSVRRNSLVDFDTKTSSYSQNEFLMNSSSSSSDSSCGGGFSSSESESMYGSKSRSSSSCYSIQRPKPIRTSISTEKLQFDLKNYHNSHKAKHESNFVKTKSKALKIYGDLKKVRQPISPGGKLASFLNSLFNAGHVKNKPKIDNLGAERKPSYSDVGVDRNSSSKSAQRGYSNSSSTCSSASSFSRSCLRKTTLSRGELSSISSSNGDVAKRSVRFCPVSVVVDEDCRPCGQMTLHEVAKPGFASAAKVSKPSLNEELGFECCVMDVDVDNDEDDHRRRIEEVARDYLLMKNYQKKENVNDEDDDDDDAESYASSDLFELDTAGVEERYRQELPVYETTFFDRNRAIGNGLVV